MGHVGRLRKSAKASLRAVLATGLPYVTVLASSRKSSKTRSNSDEWADPCALPARSRPGA